MDALRLDAIHGIFDFSANHVLAQLQAEVQALAQRLGRRVDVIAESDLNDSRVLLPPEKGGHNLDGQWSDDFHHSVHTLLTGEKTGYYADFGKLSNLAETVKNGWCYSGQYSAYRRRHFGNSPAGLARSKFVVCTQNHDQVGNRALGERLSSLVNTEALKLAAGITLLSPLTPLLFMGEEYGETSPFQYFVSHGDKDLVEAVRKGRTEEFSSFGWLAQVPDPQAESTFAASHLDHSRKSVEPHATLLRFYKHLIRFRADHSLGLRSDWQIGEPGEHLLTAVTGSGPGSLFFLFNFAAVSSTAEISIPRDDWRLRMDSGAAAWLGPGTSIPEVLRCSPASAITLHPWSFAVLECIAGG
jgi:maltooligosyltrehalose trehalohydrolase